MCIVGSQLSKVERETEVKKLSTQQIIIDKELVEEETMDDIRYQVCQQQNFEYRGARCIIYYEMDMGIGQLGKGEGAKTMICLGQMWQTNILWP